MKYNFNYYFPSIPVVITALPKAGCTSLKNFFFALEMSLQAEGAGLGAHKARGSLLYPSDPNTIHHRVPVDDFLVNPATDVAQGTTFIAVIRDPLARLISCWTDKFLLASDVDYARHFHGESWFPDPAAGPDAAEASLYQFVEQLRDSQDFREADPHWTPQVQMLLPVHKYTYVTSTDRLSALPAQLPQILAGRSPTDVPMPRFNARPPIDFRWLATERVIQAVGEAYATDCQLLDAFGLLESDYWTPQPFRVTEESWGSIRTAAQANRKRWFGSLT